MSRRKRVSPLGKTLHEVLRELGLTTAPRDREIFQGKKILDGDEVVFEGTADETWGWLRATGRIA